MAIALTLGIDSGISTAVTEYFTKFKVLPPKNVMVSQTKVLGGVHSFENLLNGILAEKATTDFVIVVHGHETGNGLFLKLVTRAGAAAGFETTNEMLKILMDISARKDPKATSDEKTKLKLTDDEVTRLLGLMTKVRDKKLGTVEFRGCNLGRNLNSIIRFREFLGATLFGGPNLHSFFGKFPTGTGANLMGNHAQSHNGTTFEYPSTIGNKKIVCCIGVNDVKKPQNGHVIADDAGALDAWIKANLDANGSMGTKTK